MLMFQVRNIHNSTKASRDQLMIKDSHIVNYNYGKKIKYGIIFRFSYQYLGLKIEFLTMCVYKTEI